MKVLVACEESQTVCKAFRSIGHEAFSCDLLDCSGGRPEWHIKGDAITEAYSGKYDLMIAHPPCTFLSYAGNVWLKQPGRIEKRIAAMDLFMLFVNAPIEKIAIENPIGYPQKAYRKPDQVIHPFQFGHEGIRKATCLWLKNLSPLKYDDLPMPPPVYIDGQTGRNRHWTDSHPGGNNEKRRKNRSKTFDGIAAAMAEQWGNYILSKTA